MEELKSLSEVDSVVRKNPNTVLIVYKEGCPYCEKLFEDLQGEEGRFHIVKISADKAAPLLNNMKAKGVPVVIPFRECDVGGVYEGYDPKIKDKLEELYQNARPVCNVDLSKVLFDKTDLGKPILI